MEPVLTGISILLETLFVAVFVSFSDDGSQLFSGFWWFDADCTICCDCFDFLVSVCAVGEVVGFASSFTGTVR